MRPTPELANDSLQQFIEAFTQQEPNTKHLEPPTQTEIISVMKQEENMVALEDILRIRMGEIATLPEKTSRTKSEKSLQDLFEEDIRPHVEATLNTKLPTPLALTRWDETVNSCATWSIVSTGVLAVSLGWMSFEPGAFALGVTVYAGTAAKISSSVLWRQLQTSYHCARIEPTGSIVKQNIYHGLLSKFPIRAVIAHEAVHAAQCQHLRLDQDTADQGDMRPFIEGMAIGVEREFLVEDCKEDVKRVRCIMDSRLYGLMKVYGTVNRITRRPQNTEILAAHNTHEYHAKGNEIYGLGDAIFSIAESRHGPGIYAEALRNPRVVLA